MAAALAGLPAASAETRGSGLPVTRDSCQGYQPLGSPDRAQQQRSSAATSPWDWALRRFRQSQDDRLTTQSAMHQACARSWFEGCSALEPRRPDSSWLSQEALRGLPETLRRKSQPCVDTWYRLVGRRDGWVRFDVTKTDRRAGVVDHRWSAPLTLEVSCATGHGRSETDLLPLRRGTPGWVGAQLFC